MRGIGSGAGEAWRRGAVLSPVRSGLSPVGAFVPSGAGLPPAADPGGEPVVCSGTAAVRAAADTGSGGAEGSSAAGAAGLPRADGADRSAADRKSVV